MSPRGHIVASGAADAAIHLSNIQLQLIWTLTGHVGPVHSLAFVDDQLLLSAGADGTIRLWDVEKRKEIRQFVGHVGRVLTVAVTPDGSRLLSGGDDSTIRLWDVSSGKQLRSFNKSAKAVWKIVLDGEGKRVLSGGDDRKMRFWSLETGDDLVSFDIEYPGPVEFRAITLSLDGSRAFSGTSELKGHFSSMRIWDTTTGQEVRRADRHHRITQNGHGVEITLPNVAARSPRDDTVLSAIQSPADGNELILWNLRNGDVIRRFGGQATRASAVAFSPDGRRIYTGSQYGRLRVWDVQTGNDVFPPIEGHDSYISSVDLTADGQRLLTGGEDLSVRLWKTSAPQRQLQVYQAARPHTAYSCAWFARFASPPDHALFFGGEYTVNHARLWNLSDWTQAEQLKVDADHSLASRFFLPDGRQFLAKFQPGFTLHDGASGLSLLDHRRAVFAGHERHIPDTRRGGPVVQLWDLEQDRILRTITPFPRFMAVTACPSAIAVSHLPDGELRLYDAELEQRHALGPNVGPVMAFSPDGGTLAAANHHGDVSLWSTASGIKVREWKYPGRVYSLCFDSTGRYLVTGNANGTAYLLRLDDK